MPLVGDELRDVLERVGFVPSPDDQIEIVGPGVTRAEKLNARKPAERRAGS